MIRIIAVAAAIGAVGGAGGGTLAATLHGKQGGQGSAPKAALALGQKASFAVPGVGLAAGDQMQRPLDLKNVGTKNFAAVALTTAASPSSTLTDSVDGLQLRIDTCSSSWKQLDGTHEYACKKPTHSVVTPRPVVGSGVVLRGLTLAKGKTAHLLLTVNLPDSAPNTLQGQTTSLTYTFTASG